MAMLSVLRIQQVVHTGATASMQPAPAQQFAVR